MNSLTGMLDMELYIFDRKTRHITDKVIQFNFPKGVNPYSLQADELYEIVGRDDVCQWYPEDTNYMHDGHGWRATIGAKFLQVSLLSGSLPVECAEGLYMADEITHRLLESIKIVSPTNAYSQDEAGTFQLQLEEAKNLDGETPILKAIAASEGRTVKEVADSILQKHLDTKVEIASFLATTNMVRIEAKRIRSIKDPTERVKEAIALYKMTL